MTTIFGWDASHYDRERFGRPLDLKAAKAAGVTFFTHKATEGTKFQDRYFAEAMANAKAAGIPVRGAYVVPRTPGNGGNGSINDQAKYFLAYLDKTVPDWRTDPLFMLQVDTEIWSANGVVYDRVSAANGAALADALVPMGKRVVHYAPRWSYGSTVPGNEPLWSSDYGANSAGSFTTIYGSRGGDIGKGWAAYAGRTPVFWQFGSRLLIGPHTRCDGNAYRGTLAQLKDFVDMRPPAPTPGPNAPGSRVLKLTDPRMSGADVLYVQRYIGAAHCGTPDAIYGPMTTSGVKWYQDMRGIDVDGVVGPVTWANMGVKWTG